MKINDYNDIKYNNGDINAVTNCSLQKHMVRKKYNFPYLTAMSKIMLHGFDRAQYCSVNQIY